MKVTRKSRLQLRAQNVLFVVLFLGVIGLLGWLSTIYTFQADWTAGNRNTLTEASQKMLATLDKPVMITVFARENPQLRKAIEDLMHKYQVIKPDIRLKFVNPDLEPQRVRDLGISSEGELLIQYRGRSEKVSDLTESNITNALERVARSSERWIVFLTGHGERNPHGSANFDLGGFGQHLEGKGFKIQTVNLAETPQIPDNTSVLVIAGPQTNLLPGEVRIVQDYVKKGGNLLWLGDPGDVHGLGPLAVQLGVSFDKGTVVDPNSQFFGINDPTNILVAKYEDSPITRNFRLVTLFAQATAIKTEKTSDWRDDAFLKTLPRSWLETGKLEGEIRFDSARGDIRGPLAIGVALTRAAPASADKKSVKSKNKTKDAPADDKSNQGQQRIVITGDGDFLANAYLGNGGNLDLGLNIMNWLSHDEQFIDINPRKAPDLTLTLTDTESGLIGLGFLFVLPGLLVAAGIVIWLKRRRS